MAPANNMFIKLSEVPRRLREDFGVSISYRRLYGLVLDGIVPAEKDETGNRWLIACNDLGQVAEMLAS
jgi:hypothetical protein